LHWEARSSIRADRDRGWDKLVLVVPVAAFVEEEFRGYLTCGLLCFGFARALCTQCTQTFVVAFSCK